MHSIETIQSHEMAVERVIVHMREHLSDPLGLDQLAELACISKFHFVRVFQEITGVTPRRFLSCLRIERAKDLLLQSTWDVTTICLEVGYNSLGTFSTTFTSLVGLAPSEYRSSRLRYDAGKLLRLARNPQSLRAPETIRGRIIAPAGNEGVYLVGNFPQGVPQGTPAGGAALLSPGTFTIGLPRHEKFFVLALMIPWSQLAGPGEYRLTAQLVGGVPARRSDCARSDLPAITLRPVRRTDPPILLSLAALR